MGFWSRKKKKFKRFATKYGRKAVRGGKWVGRRTPYGRAYSAGESTYKAGRYGYNRLKSRQKKAYGKSRKPKKKSRRGSPSSSPKNRNRRGRKYYWYRGKKIYRRK